MTACVSEPVSWLRLERYALGELSGAAATAVREHLAACPACEACFARIGADAHALPPLPARPAPRKFWTWPRLAWMGGMLATAAILLLVLRPRGAATPAVATLDERVKGGSSEIAIALVRERAGAITAEAATFVAEDRIAVRVTCGAGEVFADVVVFQRGEASFPLPPARIRCANNVAVPGAFTITGGDAQVCVAVDPTKAPDRPAVTAAGPGALVCRDLAAEVSPRAGLCAALLDDTFFEETLPASLPALGCLSETGAHVYVLCHDPAGYDALMADAQRTASAVKTLPRGWRGDRDGVAIAQFRDDDAPCLVTTNGFAGDLDALAARLTPDLAARLQALAP